MRANLTIHRLIQRASVTTGALFCLGLALVTSSCGEEKGTPEWGNGERAALVEQAAPPAVAAVAEKPQSTNSGKELRFMVFNVENWLTMERRSGKKRIEATKPEPEKQAVVALIVKHRPDVVGVAEIGTAADLADLQERLAKAGCRLPHSHFTGGSDPVRHLALLSRFPIRTTAKPKETEFKIKGRSYTINRGILDATIVRGGRDYRFLGVHLKSKRDVPGIDQETMRIHEARLLRRHVDAILKKDRRARLIVYGDFNDTRKSVAMRTVTGNYGAWNYLTAIPFRDSRGHAWTHHWEYQDIYSRIDFVAVTEAMKSAVDFRASYIVDDDGWETASDHRPLLAIFR